MYRYKYKYVLAFTAVLAAFILFSACGDGHTPSVTPSGPDTPGQTVRPAETAEKEPELPTGEFCIESEEDGIKCLLTEGSERIRSFIRSGNYLVCLENEKGGPLHIRSYSLADGSRQADYCLKDPFRGRLMNMDDGSFAYYTSYGPFLRFLSPKDPEPEGFRDRDLKEGDHCDYIFYPDGLFVRFKDGGCAIGSIYGGDSRPVDISAVSDSRRYNIYDRKGDALYFSFMTDTETRSYIYSIESGSFVETALHDIYGSLPETDSFSAINDGKGRLALKYKDGKTPDAEITLFSRTERVTGLSDDFIVTELPCGGIRNIHTLYRTDGTAVYRGDLAENGMAENYVFLKDGVLYLDSPYDEDTEGFPRINFIDAKTASAPQRRLVSAQTADKINSLESVYPVTIYYGEDVFARANEFSSEAMYDESLISEALDMLEGFLGAFPEGFFQEMYSEDGLYHPDHLYFLLTSKLKPENTASISNPAAYAYKFGSDQCIAVDVTNMISLLPTLAHETMHAIDVYLDAKTDGNAYPDWDKHLPKGFSYNESYVTESGADYFDTKYTIVDGGPIWFIDSYSKTFATEDRAMMFQSMFTGTKDAFWVGNKNITGRMSYMASVIRKHFRCMDGVDTAVWERLIPH
ncbi:MAG: hypothetical protein IJM08_00525 [Firmicutes bacterium]|nr:hypothetical protein [Bacillota bacterium]